ncbi:hypothetical protein [Streptomyces tendae]
MPSYVVCVPSVSQATTVTETSSPYVPVTVTSSRWVVAKPATKVS